jgi:drug/metabolite transporter (DMT)-like permease
MGNGEWGIGTAKQNRNPAPATGMVLAAFAAVYIIWGSTYLAIRFAIETIPPFLMAGTRFVVAGTILHVASRMRGAEAPTSANWRATGIVGGLLILGGNGGVSWAEQHVPSGVTALLVATVPLWMVLLEWGRSDGRRPTRGVIAGVILGLAGLAALVSPTDLIGRGRVDALGAAVIVAASLSWATGSIYSRRAALPADPFLASGMEMQAGGTLLLLASTVSREWIGDAFDIAMVSKKSLLALAYLLTFGSLVGYTAYTWLLRVSTPARVATYAYVNPVVAVLFGWLLAGEELTTRMLAAAAVIIAAVALITRESGVGSR